MHKTLGVTFIDGDLLLSTTVHNRPLYIYADFGKFKVARMKIMILGEKLSSRITKWRHLKSFLCYH